MRLLLTTVAAAALLTIVPGVAGRAYAHGGSYRGPAGEVPPDSREPSDPPPPPEGGGPGTPGGEDPGGATTGGGGDMGPTTGGDGGGPPTTGGGGGPPPAGGGPTGPVTGSGGRRIGGGAKGPGYEDWTFWWGFNKDEILSVKSIIKKNQRGAPTGSGAQAFKGGGGTKSTTATDAAIQTRIVPELRLLLDEKDLNFDIQSAAELALSKIGDTSIVEKLMEIARNEGKDKFNKVVVESAALSLGLMQKDTPEIREFLLEIVQDKKRNDSFVRPFAAISLGLLGSANDKDNAVAKGFMSVVNGDESKADIKPTCLLSLGLLKNDSQCETLLNMLKTGKSADGKIELEETEIAFVIQALGKIGRPGLDKSGSDTAILDTIMALLDEKSKSEKNTRRSAAIAMGQFAPVVDAKMQKKILTTLKTIIDKRDDDPQERHFALIALGRIGATPNVDKELRTECVKVLNYYLDKGKSLTPPFAAMGLGLIGRQMSLTDEGVDEETIRKPIRDRFINTKDSRARGAYAVASGLIRDSKAVKDLIDVLKNPKDDNKLRGYSALALGMIGDATAKEAVHAALTNDSDRELRVQTAVAAGLMNDPTVIPDLVKILESGEESQYILGSVSLALGQIGDERAIEPLLGIVKDDKKYPDLTRALATVALGQIGDRRDVPTLARVATDINYRAHVPALTELLTIL
ncbi:MAG: HEAT repeat domain-containing protein [Planctomycetes bacterium]|nr:HEAT repeat domain-containing protein [Planctomycetota bacterium]